MLAILIEGLAVQASYGVDGAQEKSKLKGALTDAAQVRSALLALTWDDIALLSEQVEQLPEEKELQARLRVMGKRGEIAIAALERTVDMMKKLGMDASRYDAQLLEASGKITADIFDSTIVKGVVVGCDSSDVAFFVMSRLT